MAVEVYVNVCVKEGEKRWPSAGLSQGAMPGGTRQTAEDIGWHILANGSVQLHIYILRTFIHVHINFFMYNVGTQRSLSEVFYLRQKGA